MPWLMMLCTEWAIRPASARGSWLDLAESQTEPGSSEFIGPKEYPIVSWQLNCRQPPPEFGEEGKVCRRLENSIFRGRYVKIVSWVWKNGGYRYTVTDHPSGAALNDPLGEDELEDD